jgi:hypothetical protein
MRLALRLDVRLSKMPVLLLEKADALFDVRARVEAAHTLREHARNQRRRQLAIGRQQPRAAFIVLAYDQRSELRLPIVELLLELVLDDTTLLLDDEDFLEPLGKTPDRLRRPTGGRCRRSPDRS